MLKRRLLKVFLALSVVLVLATAVVAVSYTDIGAYVDIGGIVPSDDVLAAVPQTVIDDAVKTATDLFGNYQGKCQDFINQLLTAYIEARDKDFVVIFNPGGCGSTIIDRSPGWSSIIDGINSELANLGYSTALVSYKRTSDTTLRARMEELVEIVRGYPTKVENLASRVEFLTANVPDLKVIIAGDSNGSIISDDVLNVLRDDPRVFCIQTGPPPWHKIKTAERKLVLNNNGFATDTFTQGNIVAIFVETVKTLLGLTSPEKGNEGKILYFLKAPGHSYSWQYPLVDAEITTFLDNNFGLKRS